IPYESYVGFSQEFWERENWISIHKDSCACIRVVTRNPDPQDLSSMTPRGSFYCGNTSELLARLSEEEKERYRGVCIQKGFLSVYVIPISYHETVAGEIHLADERDDRLPLKRFEFVESMAPLIGEAVNRFKLEEELRQSETRLRALSSQLLTAQESERKRIAMELHDGIGQMLTAIKFKVENILQEKGKAKEKSLEAIIRMIRESVEEVRRIQMDLRPSTLDDLGVLATLGWFCREYQKFYSRIRIEKEIGLQESEVSTPLRTVIYRVTQEAMNNIAKHSQADLIHLSLRRREDKIELFIKDNGMGFDLEEILSPERSQGGLGLSSMRERTELSGGTFAIESTKGKGTVIRASWPV
ncbi:MAG: sensor histidine kinase, partial [Desulfobacterales bacterium]|nr:sensor histidine kinase [Desulfobacterales bacterium]